MTWRQGRYSTLCRSLGSFPADIIGGRNSPAPWNGLSPLDWGPGDISCILSSETSSDNRVANALPLHAKLRLSA